MSGTISSYGTEEFVHATYGLLPSGRAWNRDRGSLQGAFWGAHADIQADVHARAAELSEIESDEAQTTELLPDFERAYGLPDPCLPLGATLQQRRGALVARIIQGGGQSRGYFIAVAAALGFTITIDEFTPMRAGLMQAGDRCRGPAWRFVWQVNVLGAGSVTRFRAGASAAGEKLTTIENTSIACLLNRLKPAHTLILFNYVSS